MVRIRTDRAAKPSRDDVTLLPADRAAAVTQLFDWHYQPLVRLARLLVDDVDTAEDVVMDGFAALHRRLFAIRDPEDAYRYLRSCVLNGARSRLRRRRTSRALDRELTQQLPDDDASQEDVSGHSADRGTVVRSLRALPQRQREVLVLRYSSTTCRGAWPTEQHGIPGPSRCPAGGRSCCNATPRSRRRTALASSSSSRSPTRSQANVS
jgi:RNA polymerase sigma factor (sigma-70 family)